MVGVLESESIEVWVQDQVASTCCVLMQNNLFPFCFLHSGPGCSMLGWDNPGLVWNLISDLKALKENSVWFFLSKIWLLDALKRM